MIRACLCMLTGVYALQLSSFAVLAVLIITVVLAGRPRIALFVTCGAILFLGAANSVMESRVDPAYVGDSIMVDVRVEGFPTQRGQTVSFIGDVADNPWVPQRVRVSWFAPSRPPKFGDRWQLELRLRRPRGSSNPGGFDYETWLFRERISATAYVVDSSRNKFLGRADLDIIEGFRRGAVERIERVVDDPEIAAVLIAISVGARHQLSSDAWTRYARTGTSHLMAISGLHIGLAAGGGYLLALLLSGLLLRNACHRQLATIAAVLVACGYALVSGLGVPAQRARGSPPRPRRSAPGRAPARRAAGSSAARRAGPRPRFGSNGSITAHSSSLKSNLAMTTALLGQ